MGASSRSVKVRYCIEWREGEWTLVRDLLMYDRPLPRTPQRKPRKMPSRHTRGQLPSRHKELSADKTLLEGKDEEMGVKKENPSSV